MDAAGSLLNMGQVPAQMYTSENFMPGQLLSDGRPMSDSSVSIPLKIIIF